MPDKLPGSDNVRLAELANTEQTAFITGNEIVSARRIGQRQKKVVIRIWRLIHPWQAINHQAQSPDRVGQGSDFVRADTLLQLRAPRNFPQFLQNLLATDKIEMPVCPGSVDQVRGRTPDH